jgi:outer membrane protein assembly factor BamB
VLDPATGETLWTRDGLPQYSQVIGTRDALFIVPQEHSQTLVYRPSDGQPLNAEGIGELIDNGLLVRGDSIVVLEAGTALFSKASKTVLRLINPLTKADSWKIEFPAQTLVSPLNDEQLLVVQKDGVAERIEVSTGQRSPLGKLPVEALNRTSRDSFALSDDEHIYLLVNTRDNDNLHHYGESLQSVRANGTVYAWSQSDGKLVWQQEVKNQNLVTDRFRSMPLLLFVSRSWKQRGNNLNYATLSLRVLNKQSGKVLHDSTTPSLYGGFHSVHVQPTEQAIELKSYNQRLKLEPQ